MMEKGFNTIYNEEVLQKRCDNIIKNKLNIIDFQLYKHCIDINLAADIFLEKWILSFFDGYTSIQNCISILDIILSQEYKYKKNNIKYNLDFIDNICLTMILKYKKELLSKNDEEFLIFCLCNTKIENIQELIKIGEFIQLKIQNQDLDINIINNNLEKSSSFIIKPKKPKYWLNINRKMKYSNYNYNLNNKDNLENNSKSFIEKKTIKNQYDKKDNIKLSNHIKNGNMSSGNLNKITLKKDILI